jgi:hypothetical protein
VTVPFRLKFWRSRGPTASIAGVLVVAGGDSWASAATGLIARPAASNKIRKRKPALIRFSSAYLNRANFPRWHRHMPPRPTLFKHGVDERTRNPVRRFA